MMTELQPDGAVDDPETMTVELDELFRVAAWEISAVTLLAARRAYLDAHADVIDDAGRRMVVGNGCARRRAVMTGEGMVDVKAPASMTAGLRSASPPRCCRPTCAVRPR